MNRAILASLTVAAAIAAAGGGFIGVRGHLHSAAPTNVTLVAAAAAQAGQSPELVRTSNPAPRASKAAEPPTLVAGTMPPGTALYVAKRGDTISLVAHHFLQQTSYLTYSQMGEAIREASGNPQGTYLKSGQELIVPGILPAPIVEKSIPVARDFEVRAVYLTGVMAGSDKGLKIIRRWRELGGNAVVFDVKDSDGSVNIPFDHPLAGSHHVAIHDLPKFTHFLHSQGMHAIARVAIFRDERLVMAHPELAVKSHKTGQAWRENGKLVWTDPSQPKVQEYDIALAKKAAESGVDEVQFDYVRFPDEPQALLSQAVYLAKPEGESQRQAVRRHLAHGGHHRHARHRSDP